MVPYNKRTQNVYVSCDQGQYIVKKYEVEEICDTKHGMMLRSIAVYLMRA